jgi:hypothetical protein
MILLGIVLESSIRVALVPLIHENTQLSLIFNLDQLLAAIGRLSECQLTSFRDVGNFEGRERTKEMFY